MRNSYLALLFLFTSVTSAGAQSPPSDSAVPPSSASGGAPHSCSSNRWYPASALANHIEGRTVVRFIIATDGTVKNPEVALSSGNADIDATSVRCVSEFQYKPAVQGDHPVEVPWVVVITFCLDNSCVARLPPLAPLATYLDRQKYPAVATPPAN
ncbi:MAG TPA: TonB family protein [Rhizomicrobium sp.]|nr:TonB family protein [Rhizomicrobium sp.]